MNGTPSLFLAFSLLVACGGEPPVPAPASDPGTTPTTAPVPPSAPPLGVEVTPSTEPSDPLRQRIVLESMGGCALGGDGGVWCWNAGFAPRQVPGVGPFVDLASSLLTRCGRSATGQIQCWRASTGTPMPAPSGAGYTDVAVTWDEACAVREGHVVCTSAAGTNENAGGLTDAVEVVASVSSVCARRSDGSVSCFEHGSPATPVAGLSGITRLAGDESLACALGSDGGVSCWGAEARFFVEGTPPTTSFLTVAGITGATDLVAGGEGGLREGRGRLALRGQRRGRPLRPGHHGGAPYGRHGDALRRRRARAERRRRMLAARQRGALPRQRQWRGAGTHDGIDGRDGGVEAGGERSRARLRSLALRRRRVCTNRGSPPVLGQRRAG